MAGKVGNKNALKHGFYGKLGPEEKAKNQEKEREDALDEIHSLRIYAKRIKERLDNKEPEKYSDADLRSINTLVEINLAIGTLLRTNALIGGKSSDVEKSIEEAIASMEERWVLA